MPFSDVPRPMQRDQAPNRRGSVRRPSAVDALAYTVNQHSDMDVEKSEPSRVDIPSKMITSPESTTGRPTGQRVVRCPVLI